MRQHRALRLPFLVNGISFPFVKAPEFVKDGESIDCSYQKPSYGYKFLVLFLCCTDKPGTVKHVEGGVGAQSKGPLYPSKSLPSHLTLARMGLCSWEAMVPEDCWPPGPAIGNL